MAIALVASVTVAGINGGPTAAINTTGATLLAVGVSWHSGGVAPTLSDSKGNTWSSLTIHTGPTALRHRFDYCLSPTVGTGHTITVSGSASFLVGIVYAYSGVASYQTESGNGHATTSPVASGSVTPSANGALVLTGLVAALDAGTPTDAVAPAGFTLTSVPQVGGSNFHQSAAYYLQPTGAAINPTWSWTGGTYTSIGVSTAVFLPAASALEVVGPSLGSTSHLGPPIVAVEVPALEIAATQLVVEVAIQQASAIDVTQAVIEYARQQPGETRVTHLLIEILKRPPAGEAQPGATIPVRRVRTFLLPTSPEGRWMFLRRLQILLQAGVGLTQGQGADPQVMIQVSRDGGQTWGPERWLRAGRVGEYDAQQIAFNIGRYRDGAVRVVVSDSVPWRFLSADGDLQEGSS